MRTQLLAPGYLPGPGIADPHTNIVICKCKSDHQVAFSLLESTVARSCEPEHTVPELILPIISCSTRGPFSRLEFLDPTE